MSFPPGNALRLLAFLLFLGGACTAPPADDPAGAASRQALEGVRIGEQVWSTANLAVRRYRNGDLIAYAETKEAFWDYGVLGVGAWCYPEGDPQAEGEYGLLYNWYAVADERGLAPEGWHVPSDYEWDRLTRTLGPDSAGVRLKTPTGWANGGQGTNESGFSAAAAGFRWHTGDYDGRGVFGSWWTSTEYPEDDYFAWFRGVGSDYAHVHRDSSSKYFGFSVRLLRDEP